MTDALVAQSAAPPVLARARAALAEAETLPDISRLVEQAEAVREVARAAKLSLDAQNDWAEFKLDTERKGGELLKRLAEQGQRAGDGRPKKPGTDGRVSGRPTLKALGVAETQAKAEHRSKRWQAIASIPAAEFAAFKAEKRAKEQEITEADVLRLAKEKKQAAAKAEKRVARKAVPPDLPHVSDRFRLLHGDLWEMAQQIEPDSVDAIITDPPYEREYLAVHGTLARVAARILKPGGSLVALVGHVYLPEIFELMTPHITYQWTLAYLLGGPSAAVWSRAALVGWKPVLWFVKGTYRGERISDVCRSDRVEKVHHDWGQSESGFDELLYRFTTPGQVVCDPFVGGGTTAVVALRGDRRFIGIDSDADAIQTTAGRIARLAAEVPAGGA